MYRSRSSPYGDVYTIPTSAVDGIANRLYQEQKVREQQKLQQDKMLDDEFAKNVAGVKSADIPDITSAYNEFKQAHINLQKKGNKATPQDQMDVMLKKANAFQAINASKEDKERIKGRLSEIKADKKGIYNPDAHTTLSEMLNTPTSKRKLDEDDDRLKYKYAMPNIDKEILNATGKAQDFDVFVGADNDDPLKDKYEVVKKINPPNVFYNSLFQTLGNRADNEGFTRSVLDTKTDEEKNKLRTDFELRIQDPRFKAIYGDVQPFPSSAANTELGQAVALKTMEAFVNLPITGEVKKVTNQDRVTKDRQKFATGMQEDRQRFAEAQQLRGYQFAIKRQENAAKLGLYKDKEGTPTPPNILDEFTVEFGEAFTDPLSGQKMTIVDVKNIPAKYRPLLTTPGITIGDKQFYVVDETGSFIGNDKQVITPVSVADNYTKTYGNTKFKLEGRKKFLEQNKIEPKKETPQPQKLESYNRADLKANGWTDDQINKAVKAGKIKVN